MTLAQMTFSFGEAGVERAEALTSYRRMKVLRQKHNEAIIGRLPRKAIIRWGKRIGVVRGNQITASSFEELVLVYDLAVHMPRTGNSSPVERYRATLKPAAGSVDDRMLDAMCHSRSALFKVKPRHTSSALTLEYMLCGV